METPVQSPARSLLQPIVARPRPKSPRPTIMSDGILGDHICWNAYRGTIGKPAVRAGPGGSGRIDYGERGRAGGAVWGSSCCARCRVLKDPQLFYWGGKEVRQM